MKCYGLPSGVFFLYQFIHFFLKLVKSANTSLFIFICFWGILSIYMALAIFSWESCPNVYLHILHEHCIRISTERFFSPILFSPIFFLPKPICLPILPVTLDGTNILQVRSLEVASSPSSPLSGPIPHQSWSPKHFWNLCMLPLVQTLIIFIRIIAELPHWSRLTPKPASTLLWRVF